MIASAVLVFVWSTLSMYFSGTQAAPVPQYLSGTVEITGWFPDSVALSDVTYYLAESQTSGAPTTYLVALDEETITDEAGSPTVETLFGAVGLSPSTVVVIVGNSDLTDIEAAAVCDVDGAEGDCVFAEFSGTTPIAATTVTITGNPTAVYTAFELEQLGTAVPTLPTNGI